MKDIDITIPPEVELADAIGGRLSWNAVAGILRRLAFQRDRQNTTIGVYKQTLTTIHGCDVSSYVQQIIEETGAV